MKNNPCRVRFFGIKRMDTSGEREEIWVEAIWKGQKNLFRIRRYSKRNYLLFFGGNSSPNQELIDCILKRILERNVIPEGGRLMWAGETKES